MVPNPPNVGFAWPNAEVVVEPNRPLLVDAFWLLPNSPVLVLLEKPPKEGVVVCGWPNAGAGVVEPNNPPEDGWAVEPNREPPLEPNTGGVVPKLVAGLLNEPNVLVVPVPKPLP